ncbi:MAG: YHS domain-containing (seleno)protein [Polaribacter sp.]
MKQILVFLLISISVNLIAQQKDYNTKKGFVAEGYDVVSYFTETKPIKGEKKYQTTHDGVKFKFSSKKNLHLFKEDPTKYIPEYGGWCAYALGLKAEKVSINPKTFEIRDGKLYLFYNAWRTNTLDLWTKEGAEELKEQADKNWEKLKKE